MATTLQGVVERVLAIMRGSKKWPRMKKRYYLDYNQDHRAPCVIIFVDSSTVDRQGVKWERENITLKVWFVEKAPKRTQTKPLYQDYEILRALLHSKSRLDTLADCERGVVAGCRQLFGSGPGYLMDIMEVTVNVWLYKQY